MKGNRQGKTTGAGQLRGIAPAMLKQGITYKRGKNKCVQVLNLNQKS
jgi:hypothetical protein